VGHQFGVLLYALVEWLLVPYLASDGVVIVLVGNGVAILVSGIYRFVLDATWTWG